MSLVLALRIAAAQPPSAITVCALPNNDLVTTATLQAAFARLDHRTQSRAAGTDHDHVVLVPFDAQATDNPHLPIRQVRSKLLVSQ